jgi:hypothetical protein
MATKSPVPSDVTEQNRALDRVLRRHPPMTLKKWKFLKQVVVSIAIIGMGVVAIYEGADPLIIGFSAIVAAGAVAGMEMSEFWAAYSDVRTAQSEQTDSNDSDSD